MLVRYAKAVPWHYWFGVLYWCAAGRLLWSNGETVLGVAAFCLAVLTLVPKKFSGYAQPSGFFMLLYTSLTLVFLIVALSHWV